MILDKLMEKKDLMIYIDMRIKHLKNTRKQIPKNTVESKRATAYKRVESRVNELERLKTVMLADEVKKFAKKYWHENAIND